jgi:hypothetical protein
MPHAFRIVARPARVLRLNAPETGFLQVALINERLNEMYGIFSTDVIINCYWQKQSLVTVVICCMHNYSWLYSTSGLFFCSARRLLRPEFPHSLDRFQNSMVI